MDSNEDLLETISEQLYSISKEHRGFFRTKKWIVDIYDSKLSKINRVDFILFQLENYPARYCSNLFLCLGNFWTQLSRIDFEKIISIVQHPSLLLPWIEFLYTVLRVDVLTLIFDSELSAKDKYLVFEYYGRFPNKLLAVSLSREEEFSNDMGVDLAELKDIGASVIAQDSKLYVSVTDHSILKSLLKKRIRVLKFKSLFSTLFS